MSAGPGLVWIEAALAGGAVVALSLAAAAGLALVIGGWRASRRRGR